MGPPGRRSAKSDTQTFTQNSARHFANIPFLRTLLSWINRTRSTAGYPGPTRKFLLFAVVMFASLSCTITIIVSLIVARQHTEGNQGITVITISLAILIAGLLAKLVYNLLQRDRELAWAYRSLDQEVREKAVVDEVGRIVTSTLEIDEVYHQFGAELSKLIDCDRIAIFVINEGAGTMEFKYLFGLRLHDQVLGETLPLKGSFTQLVAKTGDTHVWEDSPETPRFPIEKELSDLGMRAGIITPLAYKGRVFGTLNLRSLRPGVYGPREQAIVRRLAAQIGPAIENAELYKKSKRAEIAIQLEKDRYRELFETISHGIEEIDIGGTILFANAAHHKQYGYTEGGLIGKSILEFVPTDSEREELHNYLNYLADEQPPPSPYTGRKITKSGKVIDVRVDWNYSRSNGQVVGFTSLITDITGKKLPRKQSGDGQRKPR